MKHPTKTRSTYKKQEDPDESKKDCDQCGVMVYNVQRHVEQVHHKTQNTLKTSKRRHKKRQCEVCKKVLYMQRHMRQAHG